MEVEIYAIKKVKMDVTKRQAAMMTVIFGDIPVSEVFEITTPKVASKLNKINKSGKMPEVIGWASSGLNRIIFNIKM